MTNVLITNGDEWVVIFSRSDLCRLFMVPTSETYYIKDSFGQAS